MTTLPASIFKAYDIRGVVTDTLTPDNVRIIGRAIGSLARERGERAVVIGRDGRLSGPALSSALAEGLRAGGWPEENLCVAGGAAQAAIWLHERLRPGDALLLKASRGVHIENVMEELKKES